MDQHYLTPLFEPQSIVLFTGPQDQPDKQTPQALALLAHLKAQPFKGHITPLDTSTTGTLADLAQVKADLAVIALPPGEIMAALELAGRIRVKAALVLSTGIGAQQAAEMHRVAQRQGFWLLIKRYALLAGVRGTLSPHTKMASKYPASVKRLIFSH